eukprot:gene11038-7671_t
MEYQNSGLVNKKERQDISSSWAMYYEIFYLFIFLFHKVLNKMKSGSKLRDLMGERLKICSFCRERKVCCLPSRFVKSAASSRSGDGGLWLRGTLLLREPPGGSRGQGARLRRPPYASPVPPHPAAPSTAHRIDLTPVFEYSKRNRGSAILKKLVLVLINHPIADTDACRLYLYNLSSTTKEERKETHRHRQTSDSVVTTILLTTEVQPAA